MLTFNEWLRLQEDGNGPPASPWGTAAKFPVNTHTVPALNQGCGGGPGKCPPEAGSSGGGAPSPGGTTPAPPMQVTPKKQKKK